MTVNRSGFLGSRALIITVIYALIGGGWVLFSDTYLDKALHDHNMVFILVLKGILYTGITAYLLFTMVNKYDLSIKRSHDALQLEAEKFRELFENANDAIFLYELQSDGLFSNFIEVNRVACEQLGYTRDELLTMSPKDIVEEACLNKNLALINGLLERGSIIMESSHISKDGRLIPCELSLRVHALGGKKVVLSSVRYIAERKEAEAILRESEAKYRLIADNMSDLIGVLDNNGVFLYASPSHERVLGYSPQDYIASRHSIFIDSLRVFGLKVFVVSSTTDEAALPA